jgi:hypothetical protein
LFGTFHGELDSALKKQVPKSKKAFDLLALRILRGAKCAKATQAFVEKSRERFQRVIDSGGEMLK